MLARDIGLPKAKELIMLCDAIEAQEALTLGLINKVASSLEELDELVRGARATQSVSTTLVLLLCILCPFYCALTHFSRRAILGRPSTLAGLTTLLADAAAALACGCPRGHAHPSNSPWAFGN